MFDTGASVSIINDAMLIKHNLTTQAAPECIITFLNGSTAISSTTVQLGWLDSTIAYLVPNAIISVFSPRALFKECSMLTYNANGGTITNSTSSKYLRVFSSDGHMFLKVDCMRYYNYKKRPYKRPIGYVEPVIVPLAEGVPHIIASELPPAEGEFPCMQHHTQGGQFSPPVSATVGFISDHTRISSFSPHRYNTRMNSKLILTTPADSNIVDCQTSVNLPTRDLASTDSTQD
jgi:hypothetical protein